MRQTTRCRSVVKHDLGAVEAKCPPPFGEVPVISKVDADLADSCVKNWVSAISRSEAELFPKSFYMKNVLLAVFPEVYVIGVNDCRRVVQDARLFLFVHRENDHHLEFFGKLSKSFCYWTGNSLSVGVKLSILNLAKIRAIERALESK